MSVLNYKCHQTPFPQPIQSAAFSRCLSILPTQSAETSLKGWFELRMAFRKQQLCHGTSYQIKSRITKTTTTYSLVKPTEILPVNSEVPPFADLVSGSTRLLASVDLSFHDQLL